MNPLALRQPFHNCLLSSLPELEINKLHSRLSPVVLKRNQTLHHAGEREETVYFLEQGVCSIVATLKDGDTVEVGLIGRDGFVGLPALLGTGYSLTRSVMQSVGTGYSVKARSLEELCFEGPSELRRRMFRSIHGALVQSAQAAACNRVHPLEERLCRWLLSCQDRMQTDSLAVTHEALAIMLGTRRSTVTLALGVLQKSGSIELSRGRVKIKSRAALQGTACECYSVVSEEYTRLGLI
ncbi:MAG: Crp/Fnr family transcriptional regulator [Candidatus Acidiferrum sp.]